MRHVTRSTRFKASALAMSALVGVASLTAFAPEASADTVSPTGKGIVGGALLGGEVVTITEAIIGVHATWAYLVGGLVGAAGGGVGGYFVEQGSSDGRAPVYMLAGGLALVIPAVVLSLNATRYMPSEDATEDKPPTGPAADPGKAGGSVINGPGAGGEAPSAPAATPAAPPASTPAPGPAPTPPPATPGPPLSLVHVTNGTVAMGIPVPDVRPMYSLREQKELGVRQGTELRLPVFQMRF